MADFSTGLYAAISILALLFARSGRPDGVPLSVELSLFDVMTDVMGYALTYTQHSGIDQQPLGVGSPAVAPYGAFPETVRPSCSEPPTTASGRGWQGRSSTADLAADDPHLLRQLQPLRAPRHPR